MSFFNEGVLKSFSSGDIHFWNVSLDKEIKKDVFLGLSEAVYMFLHDSNTDEFSVEPMQIMYEVTDFIHKRYFVSRLVSVQPRSTVKFYKGIDKAVEAFKFASYNQGHINFNGFSFFRPKQTEQMTIIKSDFKNLFSSKDDYDFSFSSVSETYEANFNSWLSKEKKSSIDSDIRSWLDKNSDYIFDVTKKLYYPHFSLREGIPVLEEFKE